MLYSQSDDRKILVVVTKVLDKVVMIGGIKSVTLTNGKRTEMVPESSAEGGVITPDQAIVIPRLNVGTAENLATTKKSAKRRNARQIDNLLITLRISTTVTVVECSNETWSAFDVRTGFN